MILRNQIKTLTAGFVAIVTALALAAPVGATPVPTDGFAIKIFPNIGSMGGLSQSLFNSLTLVAEDRPTISITNASGSSDITGFSIQMVNSTFAFGSLIINSQQASTAIATSHLPTNAPGTHANSPSASLTFSGFSPEQIYDFRVDLDRVSDGGASLVDYKQALASGSNPSQWATVTVNFSDGQTMTEKITPSDISGACRIRTTRTSTACAASLRPARSTCKTRSPRPSRRPGCWRPSARRVWPWRPLVVDDKSGRNR